MQFLMTREITHMKAFAAALESMNKPRFMIGKIPPTAGLVDQFFNTSTGHGEDGEVDARGPWNEGAGLRSSRHLHSRHSVAPTARPHLLRVWTIARRARQPNPR